MRYSHSKLVVARGRGEAWLVEGWSLHQDGTYSIYERCSMTNDELATMIEVLQENSDNVAIEVPFEYAGHD